MDYKDKYIKYKIKYLKLKNIDINNQTGGMNNLIIHVSGSSGSGKTTLGNKLKEKFGNKIIVKDLDELLDEYFVYHFGKNTTYNLGDVDEKSYQDEFIDKQNKPLVFVGLNDNPRGIKKIYYNIKFNNIIKYIYHAILIIFN